MERKSFKMRIKRKNFIITIIMLVIILIFFLFYLKAPVTNKTQCYVSTEEAMYTAWDGSVVSGSNIISLLQNSSADDAITFVIDNGVSKKEYNAFNSALIDQFAADTYIKPTDMYVCAVMRSSDDKINMLTFNIVTSDK